MILLGGHIDLEGFEGLDSGTMVVAKKMVGTFAKHLEEAHALESLHLKLEDGAGLRVTMQARLRDKEVVGVGEAENLFFALSTAFSQVLTTLQ